MLQDYKAEEVARLTAAGNTQAEIEAMFPPTRQEQVQRAKSKISEYEQLKLDVAFLKVQVKELQKHHGNTGVIANTNSTSALTSALTSTVMSAATATSTHTSASTTTIETKDNLTVVTTVIGDNKLRGSNFKKDMKTT
jgi:hypothetical protein